MTLGVSAAALVLLALAAAAATVHAAILPHTRTDHGAELVRSKRSAFDESGPGGARGFHGQIFDEGFGNFSPVKRAKRSASLPDGGGGGGGGDRMEKRFGSRGSEGDAFTAETKAEQLQHEAAAIASARPRRADEDAVYLNWKRGHQGQPARFLFHKRQDEVDGGGGGGGEEELDRQLRAFQLFHKRAPFSLIHKRAPFGLVHKRAPFGLVHKRAFSLVHKRAPFSLIHKRIPGGDSGFYGDNTFTDGFGDFSAVRKRIPGAGGDSGFTGISTFTDGFGDFSAVKRGFGGNFGDNSAFTNGFGEFSSV